ncbi:MAG: hypothetical protein DMG34_09885 [Acidobacteria bacterium]|nr:MAG: hypothetical protein DMG34_09885 [Acidobacteriota bacterium]
MQELHNALLIHNPNAGSGGNARRVKVDEARRILEARGIQADLAETTAPGEAIEIARRASTDGRQLENGHRVPLALLPAGTANVLAKELELSWDIPKAAEQLARGEVRDIALGLATPLEEPEKARYFLSVAGAGPDGRITYSVDLELKARLGILAYWWQGAREVFNYKFHHFRVSIEGQSREVSLVIVGRTKHYGGPFKITTKADLFEDQFEFVGLTTQSGLKYLSYLPTLWFGDLRKEEGVYFWKSDRLVSEPTNEAPIYAQIDGEPLARLPVEFRIVPRALRLLVPGPAQLPSGAK